MMPPIPLWAFVLLLLAVAILLRIVLPRVFAEFLRRADLAIIFVRSTFDDPKTAGKSSMARVCAAVAIAAGIWTTVQTVHFAFALLAAPAGGAAVGTGALGVLAGLATTLFGTVCVGLLKRTTATGVSEPVDDTPPPAPPTSTDITVKTTTGAP